MTQRGAGGKPCLILTCEHARNRVPRELRVLFIEKSHVLETHRGYDLGALSLAETLANTFNAPLLASGYTRLVCDLNRSLGNPSLYSEFTRHLPQTDRDRIIQTYYIPHRTTVETTILKCVRGNQRVVHIGVHTFTPNLNGQHRNADIGLLYDPQRLREKKLCLRWQHVLAQMDSTLRVRRNYPYRGESDGLPRHFRKLLPEQVYTGIELEVNQKLYLMGKGEWKRVGSILSESLKMVLGERLI